MPLFPKLVSPAAWGRRSISATARPRAESASAPDTPTIPAPSTMASTWCEGMKKLSPGFVYLLHTDQTERCSSETSVLAGILNLMKFEVRAFFGAALVLDDLHNLELVLGARPIAKNNARQIGEFIIEFPGRLVF